ncbi:MAG: copper chaperone PCu(A)C [Gammaproteobacteria bacterium]|nr:copper chaperone PCu(A)C [Gammaproteobacteria bacterium]
MNLKLKLVSLLVALFLPVMALAAHNHSNLDIQHSWIKAPVPGTMMTGGFISITNNGKHDEQLVAAYSDIAKNTELHTMVMIDGVMKMREVEGGWVIPAGETLTLAPGGNHIMFIGLTSMLMEGDKQILTLEFKHAGKVERAFMIHKPENANMSDGHSHDDSHSDH